MVKHSVKIDNPAESDDDRALCDIPFAELDEEGQCEVLAAIKLGNYHYKNITTLAEKLKVSYPTVYRRLKSPIYKQKQSELLDEFVGDLMKKAYRDIGEDILADIPKVNSKGKPYTDKEIRAMKDKRRAFLMDFIKTHKELKIDAGFDPATTELIGKIFGAAARDAKTEDADS